MFAQTKRMLDSRGGAVLLIAAVIVVTSVTTAAASHAINGKTIKKGTIAGSKLKKDTVTGKYIKESSLGKVPAAATADNVGGVAASALVQGGGHVYHGSNNGTAGQNGIVLLDIPGIGTVTYDCVAGPNSVPHFTNHAGYALAIVGSTTYETTGPDYTVLAPDSAETGDGSTETLPQRHTGTATINAWKFSGAGKAVTIDIAGYACGLTATAITNF